VKPPQAHAAATAAEVAAAHVAACRRAVQQVKAAAEAAAQHSAACLESARNAAKPASAAAEAAAAHAREAAAAAADAAATWDAADKLRAVSVKAGLEAGTWATTAFAMRKRASRCAVGRCSAGQLLPSAAAQHAGIGGCCAWHMGRKHFIWLQPGLVR
jgi:SWI/SNF-related matrix-associated actin-dependent regulator 1 of chromatin subfamily A